MENANQAVNQTKTLFDILAEEGEITQTGQTCPDKAEPVAREALTTQITVPTLHEAAVLSSLSISMPGMTKLDRAISEEVARSKGADKGTFKGHKTLIKKEHMDPISQVKHKARNYHNAQTVPWGENLRLLTNERLIDHQNFMAECEREYNAAVQQLLDKWPTLVMQAGLGSMYDPNDYPSVNVLARKFGFRVTYEPVPVPGAVDDIRTNLPDTVRSEMKRQYEELIEARSREVAQDVWKRLYEPLVNMSEKLVDKDEGKPSGFKSTLVDNVLKIVDLMKAFNLTNDPNMDRVRRELRDALTGVTYDKLKASDSLRAQTKEKVDKVVASVEQIQSTLDW